jgi:hypothetical protein
MGIRGLGGFIKWKTPNARKSLNLIAYTGQSWGVDCSCLLYRARGSNLSATTVIASLLVRLRKAKITPIFIFDGKPPAAKNDVVDQRREQRQAVQKEMAEIKVGLEDESLSMTEKANMEHRHAALQKKAPTVSSGDKDEIKRLLHAAGVQFITATGEADDVLAYMGRNGTIQGVISTDMDMLARGLRLLVIPETADTSVLTEIRLDHVLAGLGLTYPQFVDACMLMGSDYSGKDWISVDPKEAVARAKRGMVLPAEMEAGVALLTGAGIQWEEIVGEKQRAKWDMGRKACEPDMLATFAEGWPAEWVSVLGCEL